MSSNPYIFGLHDPGGEHLLQGRGWVLFTELVSEGGKDYRHYANQGLGVIVRLNHAYGPTLPAPDRYGEFAKQCASFVATSQGCTTWVIGNEPNHQQEGRIPFDSYADGFNQAANAIRRAQPGATVCIAAVAPWNMDAGDWLFYFAQLVRLCHCDGITLHTYTHGVDPALVHSDEKMQSHPDRFYHFKAYRDFMAAIPVNKRHLPVYITETDQDDAWANVNSGWIQNAYGEINWWNQQPGNQQIRALIIYRWPNHDKWGFREKTGVHDDLRAAVAKGYQWRDVQPQVLPAPETWTGYVTATNGLNLRTEPHTTANVVTTIAMGEQIAISDRRGDWLAATYGLLSGWVSAQWVGEQKPTFNDNSTTDQRSAIIAKLAAEYGVDERLAKAVIKIESGGSGFRNGRLIMRFEPHVFKSQLKELFEQHFEIGNPAWDGEQHQMRFAGGDWGSFHGNQDEEYEALDLAQLLAKEAALRSASYGAGQIMGFNYASVGYRSAEEMKTAFEKSEEAQIRAMFEYFRNRGLIEKLKAGDLLGFASGYNGPANAAHYEKLIREAMR